MIAPWKNEKVRLMYQRPEIKASVEIILSVFTVAGLLLLAIRPTLATVATLQKKIEDQQVVSRRLEAKISQLVNAQKNLVTYANRLADYEVAVPDTHDLGSLAKRVEVLASEQGLAVNGLSFSAVPLLGVEINLADKKGGGQPTTEFGGKIATFEISFDLSGAPNRIFDFLPALEKMDRVAIVNEIDIKKEILQGDTKEAVVGVKAVGKARGYYVFANEP
ncbi:MAG: hypothetical protein AAB973_00840 [Patescibacteria group bacterium]